MLRRKLHCSGENSATQEKTPLLRRELCHSEENSAEFCCSGGSSAARERTPLSSAAQEKSSAARERTPLSSAA
ncbi:hypothetical protein U1Q18_015241 [Sarracenia purpurea var. burkii]